MGGIRISISKVPVISQVFAYGGVHEINGGVQAANGIQNKAGFWSSYINGICIILITAAALRIDHDQVDRVQVFVSKNMGGIWNGIRAAISKVPKPIRDGFSGGSGGIGEDNTERRATLVNISRKVRARCF